MINDGMQFCTVLSAKLKSEVDYPWKLHWTSLLPSRESSSTKPNHKPIISGLFPVLVILPFMALGFPVLRCFVISFQFPSPHVPNSSRTHLVKPNFRGQDEMKQVPLVNCRPCGDSWVEKKLGHLGPNGPTYGFEWDVDEVSFRFEWDFNDQSGSFGWFLATLCSPQKTGSEWVWWI